MNYSVFYHHICQAAEEENHSLEEMLSEVKSLGFDYVELDRDAIGADDQQILALSQLAKHGLQPSSIYGFYDWGHSSLPDEDDLLLRQARLMGCKRVMVIPGFYTDLTDPQQCSAEKAGMIAGMQQFVRRAGEMGITVTIECFDDARSPIATIAGMAEFLDAVPQLYVTLETGNFIFSGDSILEAQQRFCQRVRHVHLKDRWMPECTADAMPPEIRSGSPATAVTGRLLYPCAVGQGHIPIPQVISGLAQADYEGILTVEHFGVSSYASAIRDSIRWLKELEVKA